MKDPYKLSILIPTVPEDEVYFIPLMRELRKQIFPTFERQIELVIESDNGEQTTGAKRNKALRRSEGTYVAFVDSDDMVAPNYIQHLMEGIDKGVDCCSLKGIYTVDGRNPEIFEHSLQYQEYKTINAMTYPGVKHERHPNHLNAMRSSVAKQFKFPNQNVSEDTAWATLVHKSGLLKVEHYIPEIIYFYTKRKS